MQRTQLALSPCFPRGRALAAAAGLAGGLAMLAWPGAQPATSEPAMPENDVNLIRNIRVPATAARAPAGPGPAEPRSLPGVPGFSLAAEDPARVAALGVPVAPGVAAAPGEIEVELESSRPFEVRNQLPVLRIGGREYSKCRYPEDGSLNRLVFYLPAEEFPRPPAPPGAPGVSPIAGVAAALKREPVEVYYGSGAGERKWRFSAPGVGDGGR